MKTAGFVITITIFFLLIPQTGFTETLFGKNGIQFHVNFTNPASGSDYIDLIDSGNGLGVDYLYSVGNRFYIRTGFDYYNFGESNFDMNDLYYQNNDAFNFHMYHISAGLRYVRNDLSLSPYLEINPGFYINRLGKNSYNPPSYIDDNAAGLNFGGGIMIPFYGGGLFEFGAKYNIDFISDSSLRFFSFTGGISYYFKSNESEPGNGH